MRTKQVSLVVGVALGFCVVFLLGAAYENMKLSGEVTIKQKNIYQSALSGVTANGECYLAVTNATTGRTEVFLISEKLNEQFPETPKQQGKNGSLIFFGP